MFSVERRDGDIPLIELHDGASGSLAVLAPDRGGMATRLRIAGEEVFFLDEVSFNSPPGNVRGGNPVLFPSPGKLTEDGWARDGHSGSMKQHGFARNLAWSVVETGTEGAASATLRLVHDEDSKGRYPWDFVADYTYALKGDALRITQKVTNTGDAEMPFGLGFHPYFQVPQAEKSQAVLTTGATRVYDNAARAEIAFGGFDLGADEVDYHLLDHGSTRGTLSRPGWDRQVVVECSEEFTHWVVWTLKGRDFVCLEPWTCPGDALNTGERLMRLAPGQSKEVWTEIAFR